MFTTDGKVEPRIASFHRAIRGFLGDYRPDQLSESLLRDYIASRPLTSARREIEELRAAIPDDLRKCKFPLPAPRPPRETFISRDEAKSLLSHATAYHSKLFILIAMSTGQRAGAILGLTWDRVMWDSGVLDFRDPDKDENRKRRGVCPVDARVIKALREAREIAQTPYVIEYGGHKVECIKTAFRNAATAAKVKCSPHILKHSVISWLAMDGHTAEAISDFTSTDVKTVRRIYRKIDPGYLQGLADDLGNGLMGDADRVEFSAPKRDKCKHRLHKRT